MKQYTKKPVTVEAIQWTDKNDTKIIKLLQEYKCNILGFEITYHTYNSIRTIKIQKPRYYIFLKRGDYFIIGDNFFDVLTEMEFLAEYNKIDDSLDEICKTIKKEYLKLENKAKIKEVLDKIPKGSLVDIIVRQPAEIREIEIKCNVE